MTMLISFSLKDTIVVASSKSKNDNDEIRNIKNGYYSGIGYKPFYDKLYEHLQGKNINEHLLIKAALKAKKDLFEIKGADLKELQKEIFFSAALITVRNNKDQLNNVFYSPYLNKLFFPSKQIQDCESTVAPLNYEVFISPPKDAKEDVVSDIRKLIKVTLKELNPNIEKLLSSCFLIMSKDSKEIDSNFVFSILR